MKDSVDLCDKKRCLTLVAGLEVRDDCLSPHLPSHDVLKLRTAIHPFREFGEVYRKAQSAVKTVRGIFADLAIEGERRRAGKQPPKCVKCHQIVTLPCWYCAECRGVSPRLRSLNKPLNCSLCSREDLRVRFVRRQGGRHHRWEA